MRTRHIYYYNRLQPNSCSVDNSCEACPSGACCGTSEGCVIVTPYKCMELKGNYLGDDTECSECEKYCFEKDNGDCVEQLCAGSPPLINGSPEPGWVQVDGPYVDGSCTGCAMACEGYSTWRIIDQSSNIHAMGSISSNGSLLYIPSPFVPQFYNTTGSQTYKLQADYGDNSWQDLDTWTSTISLCGSSSDRFPSHSFSGPWIRQEPYNHKISIVTGQPICNETCADLNPGLIGDGQEWKNPLPSGAYKFTGSVDGEWTNLNNWEDASGNSPARYLPDINSDVTISSDVNSKPNNYNIVVKSLTIDSDVNFNIEASCADLVCNGIVGRPNNPDCVDTYGKITYSVSAVFNGSINGELIQDVLASDAIFNGTNDTNDTTFYGIDANAIITGSVELNNNAVNIGIVNGNATFNDFSQAFNTISGNLTFNNDSKNHTLETNINDTSIYIFNDDSDNRQNVINATFNDDSTNNGSAFGNTIFNDRSVNKYFAGAGPDPSTVTFNNNSINEVSVSHNAIFKNQSRNKGSVGGTAEFINDSCNDGGTATTFIPDPPPACSP